MQVQTIKPINFLFYRATTTLQELPSFAAVNQELFAEAVRLRIPITGASQWHYFGLTDMTKPFIVEISVPVGKAVEGYDGRFHFKRTEPFKAVTGVHYGPWEKLPQTYDKLFAFIREKSYSPTAAVREVYINADFDDPEANVTEIQIGIL